MFVLILKKLKNYRQELVLALCSPVFSNKNKTHKSMTTNDVCKRWRIWLPSVNLSRFYLQEMIAPFTYNLAEMGHQLKHAVGVPFKISPQNVNILNNLPNLTNLKIVARNLSQLDGHQFLALKTPTSRIIYEEVW